MEKRRYPCTHSAYYPRHSLHLRDLPENHIKRTKEVPFEFHDYKVPMSPCRPTINSHACPTNVPSSSALTTTEFKAHTKSPNATKWPRCSTSAWASINTSAPSRSGTLNTSPKASTAETGTVCPTLDCDSYKTMTIFRHGYVSGLNQINWRVAWCCRKMEECWPHRPDTQM